MRNVTIGLAFFSEQGRRADFCPLATGKASSRVRRASGARTSAALVDARARKICAAREPNRMLLRLRARALFPTLTSGLFFAFHSRRTDRGDRFAAQASRLPFQHGQNNHSVRLRRDAHVACSRRPRHGGVPASKPAPRRSAPVRGADAHAGARKRHPGARTGAGKRRSYVFFKFARCGCRSIIRARGLSSRGDSHSSSTCEIRRQLSNRFSQPRGELRFLAELPELASKHAVVAGRPC